MDLFETILLDPLFEWSDLVESSNAKFHLLSSFPETSILKILKKAGLMNLSDEVRQHFFDAICIRNLSQALALFQSELSLSYMMNHVKCKDVFGHNALMRTAKNASDQVLMTLISFTFFNPQYTFEEKFSLLHDQDLEGRTLLRIVVAQDEELTFAKEMIFKIERDFHRGTESQDVVPLTKCFQNKLGPSKEVAQALKDEESYINPTKGKTKTVLKVIFKCAIPLGIILQDIITDSLLTKGYFNDMIQPNSDNISESNCFVYDRASCSPRYAMIEGLEQYPMELKPLPCFWYSLVFLLLPLPCYMVEWWFQESHHLRKKVSETFEKEGKNVCLKVCLIYWFMVHMIWVLLWPIINLLKAFIKEARYRTLKGEEKTKYFKLWENKTTQYVRSHMLESCLESTFQVKSQLKIKEIFYQLYFQPLLQVYLVLPCLLKDFDCFSTDVKVTQVTRLQSLAIITSILSLTFTFTKHFALKQNGALDIGFEPLAYIVVLSSTVMQVSFKAVIKF